MGFWDTPPPWGVDPGLPPGYQPPPDPLVAAMLGQEPGAVLPTSQAQARGFVDKLGETWPAKLAQSAWSGVTLPGDVYHGKVDMNSDEGTGRALDLAGLMVGAPVAFGPRAAAGEVLGSGAIRPSAAGAADVASGMAEKITSAASRIGDEIHTGPTHVESSGSLAAKMGIPFDEFVDLSGNINGFENGFITSKGRFVSRDEAFKIASGQGQTKLSEAAIREDQGKSAWPKDPTTLEAEHLKQAEHPSGGMLQSEPPSITAYHGSPHEFAAGAPAFAKVPLGAGEAVLGSGAIRPSAAGAADVASGMTGDALIAKLSKTFEPQSEHPINEGGQMVSLFLPNGKVVAQNYPSHNQLLQAAGIDMPLEEFMGKTGAVRAHGPDNYEIHAPLSTSQIRAIREYAKDHGANTVNVDVSTGDGTFKSEMFHLPNEASDLKDFASDAKGWSSSSPFPDPNSGAPASGGMLQAEPPSITAYHGSPHDFDKFDLSKIGTGEGAQAYGHGLYFAENEGVARGYRDKLAGPVLDQGVSTAWVKQAGGDRAAAEASFKDHIGYDRLVERANSGDRGAQVFLNESEDVLAGIRKPHGHMYEARIHADSEHFLDWDKPLSQQHPKVQEAIKRMASKYGVEPDMSIMGADAYHSVASNLADPNITAMNASQRAGAPNAAEHFREAGIPGIKYLDAGSRGGMPNQALADANAAHRDIASQISALQDQMVDAQAAKYGLPASAKEWGMLGVEPSPEIRAQYQPQMDALKAQLQDAVDKVEQAKLIKPKETHNYVTFRDDIIEILRKYGLAGLGLAGYGASQSQGQPPQ